MALLLAMYQKMRLIRERNKVTLDIAKYTGKLTKVSDNIERVQKKYAAMLANLEKRAQAMTSNAPSIFNNMMGVGTNNYASYLNPYGFTGINGFIMQTANSIMSGRGMAYRNGADENGKATMGYWGGLTPDKLQIMWAHYNQNGGRFVPMTEKDENGNVNTLYRTDSDEGGRILYGVADGTPSDTIPRYDGFTQEDVNLFNFAIQQAQMQQTQAQTQAQTLSQRYSENVSIWLEAQKSEIEAQQEAALAPLSYQETMWELEKTTLEAKLERIKREEEAYNTLLADETDKAVPKFGLR